MSSNAASPQVTEDISPKGTNGQIVAWSLWDWGSAAFNAVVLTFVFSVYITSASFGPEEETSSKLSFTVMIAGVIVALTAPVVSQITDQGGRRKQWLALNTAIVVASIALLVFVAPSPEFLVLGLILLTVGNIAFEFASVSYNSMLKQISTDANVGRISGFGWGMGYIGGIVLLGILLVGFVFPEVGWFGVTSDNGWNIRIAMLVSAAWFGLFALPVFFAVPELPRTVGSAKKGLIAGYKDLFQSLKNLWQTSRQTLIFLLASAVFRDGLAGVFTFGGVIAALSFGFDPTTVIVFAIAANVIAGLATISIGAIEDKLGSKNIMVWSIVLMLICATTMFILHDNGTWVFWVFGLLLCIFVGPVQSASRSFLSKLIPAGREGEIFGLYATTGRAVSFLAPGAFTIAVTLGGATIFGIIGIAIVLLVGLVLLIPVKPYPHLEQQETVVPHVLP